MSILGVGIEWVDAERFSRVERRFGVQASRSAIHLRRVRIRSALHRSEPLSPGLGRALCSQSGGPSGARECGVFGIGLREVEVLRNPQGRPGLQLHGSARQGASAIGVVGVLVTLTHDRQHCIGQVILEAAS